MVEDRANQVCVVTGASSGIGKEIARNLARRGATVVLACRDASKGELARRDIADDTGNQRVTLLWVDLASRGSIRRAAAHLLDQHPRIHILVNNAGVCLTERRIGEDGIEVTWATNVLGYHLLTRLLLDRLMTSAPARIVNVASTYAGGLDLTDPEFRRRPYNGVAAYRQSKQAERMLTWALAERLAGTGVTANAAYPGGVATGIYRDFQGFRGALLRAWVGVVKASPPDGADTPTWLATSPDLAGESGKFWSARRELRCPFRDPVALEGLWAVCEGMLVGAAPARSTCFVGPTTPCQSP